MSKRSEALLFQDILASAQKILHYTHLMSFNDFYNDDKTIDAVVRNFEIIGEAASRLQPETRERYPTIDWHRIRGFRNRIVHDYMGIDYSIVWQIKEKYLPHLIAETQQIIASNHW